MKILGIDSSAKSASVAVVEDSKILSSFFIHSGLTHSQTLMPMIDNALKCAEIPLNEIGIIAVNKGPGSFTGIRIGVAAAKGLADTLSIKTCGVSTLLSMAYNLLPFDCVACCVMNARCNQVYTSLFDITGSVVTRITDDCAISIDELALKLKDIDKRIILVGDGADLCFDKFKDILPEIEVASEAYKYQNAAGVCFAAENTPSEQYCNSCELIPEYIRLPQAERELNNKLKKVSD